MLKITYTAKMKKPYNNAFETPDPLFCPLFLVKKLTVKGIIGNTQGVSNANNPPKKPSPKIFHRDLPPLCISDELLFRFLLFG